MQLRIISQPYIKEIQMNKLFLLSALVLPCLAARASDTAPKILVEAPTYVPAKAVTDVPAAVKSVTDVPDCRPSQTNTGGDNIGTKVICSCESAKCPEAKAKAIACPKLKPVTCPEAKTITKTVEKPVVKIKTVTKTVEKVVDRVVPQPFPVDRIVEKIVDESGLTVNLLMGQGPDGVRPYRYEDEYRAQVGTGILMGAEVGYTFSNGLDVGGLYINNDTKMLKVGYKFKFK